MKYSVRMSTRFKKDMKLVQKRGYDQRLIFSVIEMLAKLKVLMLAFYIDLSGVSQRPFIDRALLASITAAAIRSGLDKHQIDELYMDTVQADTTPSHVMTVKDSLYLLELCLAGRELEAEELLTGLLKTAYVSE